MWGGGEERESKLLGRVSCSGGISRLRIVRGKEVKSKLLRMVRYLGGVRGKHF